MAGYMGVFGFGIRFGDRKSARTNSNTPKPGDTATEKSPEEPVFK